MRRMITEREAEYLEAGEEPAHVIATGRAGRGEIEELLVYYVGDTTVVDCVKFAYAFDEVLEPSEVLEEYEQHRWK